MAKLQHYVPQSYLRHFAAENGKTPKIWCFDKFTRQAFKTNVRNIAAEKHFYHPQNDQEQPVEDLLARVETEFAQARRRLLQLTDGQTLADQDRAIVALFLAAQMVRTREHRAQLEQVNEIMRDFLMSNPTEELQRLYGVYNADTIRQQQVDNLLTDFVPTLGEIILKMKWLLLFNETDQPFWTSDNPIALFNPVNLGVRGNLGLKCDGIQAFLPLSPSVTFAVCDPKMYAEMPIRGNLTPENVAFQNSLQVNGATRYLFGPEAKFDLANEVLTDHPELADPERRRVLRG